MFSGFTLKTESREKLFSKQMSVLYMVHFRVYGDYLTLQGQMLSLFHNTLCLHRQSLKNGKSNKSFLPDIQLAKWHPDPRNSSLSITNSSLMATSCGEWYKTD